MNRTKILKPIFLGSILACSMFVAEASASVTANRIETGDKVQMRQSRAGDDFAIIFVGGKNKTPVQSNTQQKSQPPQRPPQAKPK
jgi:hypothetical protein